MNFNLHLECYRWCQSGGQPLSIYAVANGTDKCRQVPKPTLPQEQNPSVVDESTILPRANSVDR